MTVVVDYAGAAWGGDGAAAGVSRTGAALKVMRKKKPTVFAGVPTVYAGHKQCQRDAALRSLDVRAGRRAAAARMGARRSRS